jgi:protein CpxP
MKKLICILIAVATLSVTLPAQAQQERKTPPTPEQRAERRANHLKTQLVLTEEQYVQVKAAALKIEKEKNSKDMKNKAGERFEAALQGILNPEQMEKYTSMREERKEKVKERMEEKRNEEKTKSEGATEDKN